LTLKYHKIGCFGRQYHVLCFCGLGHTWFLFGISCERPKQPWKGTTKRMYYIILLFDFWIFLLELVPSQSWARQRWR
jgi:hypothetical protein